MRIAVYTSNQPRHLNLIRLLSGIADEIIVVQECNTVFPGKLSDFFSNSPVMEKYFQYVLSSEEKLFGSASLVRIPGEYMALKMGDLSYVDISSLDMALSCDYQIIFGSSYIRGELADILIDKKALNIHMGISPYYRGSSCNFWAMFDGRPDFVGATIHLLSKGLDSGDILFHGLPGSGKVSGFDLGMEAVRAAQEGLCAYLKTGEIDTFGALKQDKGLEMRYTRYKDFTDEVAEQYLARELDTDWVEEKLLERDMSIFVNPYVLDR